MVGNIIGKPVFLYYDGRIRRGVVFKEGELPGWFIIKFEGMYTSQHEYDFVIVPEEPQKS